MLNQFVRGVGLVLLLQGITFRNSLRPLDNRITASPASAVGWTGATVICVPGLLVCGHHPE